jgi:myo-inositol catabolism protein IolC
MKKNEFTKEVVDAIVETDFNPDIVIPAIEETYEVGLTTGWWKGFGIGFGIPMVGLTALVAVYEHAKKRNAKRKEKES